MSTSPMRRLPSIAIAVLLSALAAGCVVGQGRFNEIVENPTLDKCRAFEKKYPKSPFIDYVRMKHEGLAWERAVRDDTARAYRDFLDDFPDSLRAREAGRRRGHLLLR
ncbi:MAG: hypothetical protein ACYTAF_16615 [Planctomycetota bacterium]